MALEASMPVRRWRGISFPALSLGALMDAQAGRLLLWSPVLIVTGIWAYFALPAEPSLFVSGIAVAALTGGLVLIWRGAGGVALKIACLILLGFVVAKARTELVTAPALTSPTGKVELLGVIADIDIRSARVATLTVDVNALTGEGIRQIPRRARLTAIGEQPAFRPGMEIRAPARLFPLPAPAVPGGYDFGRALWFEGIGATGRTLGPIAITGSRNSPLAVTQGFLHDLRATIGARLRAAMAPERAAIAEALITGERASIPRTVNDSLQISGLAHILSISGLHMSLVAGGFFWLVRALLALSPTLAIAYPIKKWSALAGLAAGLAYLVIAVTSVATQRAYLMIAIMFIAILADRPALSLRNLALAALCVVLVFPEEALSASLQMSFLAVMGILAFHEVWSGRQRSEERAVRGRLAIMLLYMGRALMLAAITTIAAGGLSSIAAAYHFGRLAPYSILANMLAFPIISLVIMPAALLGVLLMPLGLETLPLLLMDEGLRLLLAISDGVRDLPYAEASVSALPLSAALALTAAAVALCLFRGRLRLMALPLAAAGVLLAMTGSVPDVLIERTGANAAIRRAGGTLAFANGRRGRFAAELWLRNNGEKPVLADAFGRGGWTCEAASCRAEVRGRRVLYLHEGKEPAQFSCDAADIVIADFPLRGRCRAIPVRIDRFDVWRSGAHALYIAGNDIRIETARARQGKRPWTIEPEPRLNSNR